MTKAGRLARAKVYYENMQKGLITKELYESRIAAIFKGQDAELQEHKNEVGAV